MEGEKITDRRNLYELLCVDRNASYETIKQSYQRLVLKYHPDKLNSAAGSREELETAKENFIKVDKAWKILSQVELRKAYDIKLKEKELHQDWPVNENIELQEMDWDEEDQCYTHTCRCGGEYIVSVAEAELTSTIHLIICCSNCTLSIRVWDTNS